MDGMTRDLPRRSLDDLMGKTDLTGSELAQVGRSVAKSVRGLVETFFRANRGAIQTLLPVGMNDERLLKIALSAIRRRPQLQECTVASLFGAVILCAQMGLEPDTPDQHCFLIPRCNKTARRGPDGAVIKGPDGRWIMDEVWQVNVQLGWRGRVELAYRSPKIRSLKPVVVRANDAIEIQEGTRGTIQHAVKFGGTRGDIVGFYAVAELATGVKLFEIMDRIDVERVRDEYSDAYAMANRKINVARFALEQAKTDKAKEKAQRDLDRAMDTPWITDFEAMGKKTVLNRIYNILPKTSEMRIADSLETTTVAQDLEAVLQDGTFVVGEPGEWTDEDAEPVDATEGRADEERRTEAASEPASTETAVASEAESREESPVADNGGGEAAQITHERTVTLGDLFAEKPKEPVTQTTTAADEPPVNDRPEPLRSRANLFANME